MHHMSLNRFAACRDRQRHVLAFQAALQAVLENPLLTHPEVPQMAQPTATTVPEMRATVTAASAALQAAKKLPAEDTEQGTSYTSLILPCCAVQAWASPWQ